MLYIFDTNVNNAILTIANVNNAILIIANVNNAR